MMFEQFAEQHGLIIDQIIIDRWVRVPTTDHPHKKNGAYIFDGKSGAIQNWAIHDKPISYFPDIRESFNPERKKKQVDTRLKDNQKAKDKAQWMLDKAIISQHPYFIKKGFNGEKGFVLGNLLIIPMRINGSLVGCQTINENGDKKFLKGQVTKGASAIFDGKGMDIYCEGYATALSIRRALKSIHQKYTIHVAFSAGNLANIAKHGSFVVADNDTMGVRMAKEITDRYWLSDVEGEDANDYEKRLGTDALAKSLLKVQF